MSSNTTDSSSLASSLLRWYDQNGRELPWRVRRGISPSPYQIWISEIMLQQTTVATVISYFKKFTQRWPTLHDLASASLDEVLHAWQGLGYYARARNMHKCAQLLVEHYEGRFPCSFNLLKTLPGIGSYTAAAIASIAFEEKITPVDGNVIRVLSRLYALEETFPSNTKTIFSLAQTLTPDHRKGDFAQALMDLGATVCTPRLPKCSICPWQQGCKGSLQGIATELPRKKRPAVNPKRYAVAFAITRKDGSILVRKRQEKGLLGGMIEVPSTPWREEKYSLEEASTLSPLSHEIFWDKGIEEVKHIFTHFTLEVKVFKGLVGDVPAALPSSLFWATQDDLLNLALPTLMKKILRSVSS
jgi:A/G-specific adenine glycosylase